MKPKPYQAFISCMFVVLSIVTFHPAKGQTISNNFSSQIPESYDRSSLSWIIVTDKTHTHVTKLSNSLSRLPHSDKFFHNTLNNICIEVRGGRDHNNKLPSVRIKEALENSAVPNEIIAHWYSRQSDGTMDMKRIHQRGMMNATDTDVLRYQTTTRGNMALMDYGNRLINKSYIVALDIMEFEDVNDSEKTGFKATVAASLFKIEISEEDKGHIYDAWVVDSDSPAEKKNKMDLFRQINPPLEFITQINTSGSSYNYKEHTFLGKITPQKTNSELYQSLLETVYNSIINELEREHADFNIVTPLYSTKPLRAKIGKKEGLKVDQRFFVYEHRYNRRTNQVREVRRGVVRATNQITDNRQVATGDMKPSTFYQVAGGKLREGFVLQQQNDYGVALNIGYHLDVFEGPYIGLEAAVGRSINVKAFYLIGSIGFTDKDHPEASADFPGGNTSDEYSFFRWDAGIAKGYHFLRNFELNPSFSYGQEKATLDEAELTGHFLKASLGLALNITHNMQIMGAFNSLHFFGNAYFETDEQEYKYTDVFNERDGQNLSVGLRFRF